MFGLIKQVLFALLSFNESLASMANISNFTTYISLNIQLCMTRPTLIDLNPDEYNEALRYYPFMVNLERCKRRCNTLDDPSGQIFVPNEIEDVNLNVFNMKTGINESKTLIKLTS